MKQHEFTNIARRAVPLAVAEVLVNGADNPQKLPILFGGFPPHLIHRSLGQPDSAPHLDRFNRFRRVH